MFDMNKQSAARRYGASLKEEEQEEEEVNAHTSVNQKKKRKAETLYYDFC
jgi:hypothetical protein